MDAAVNPLAKKQNKMLHTTLHQRHILCLWTDTWHTKHVQPQADSAISLYAKYDLFIRTIILYYSQSESIKDWHITAQPTMTAHWLAENDKKWTVSLRVDLVEPFIIKVMQ